MKLGIRVSVATISRYLCAFSIFVLVEIVQLFVLVFIAHPRIIQPPIA